MYLKPLSFEFLFEFLKNYLTTNFAKKSIDFFPENQKIINGLKEIFSKYPNLINNSESFVDSIIEEEFEVKTLSDDEKKLILDIKSLYIYCKNIYFSNKIIPEYMYNG